MTQTPPPLPPAERTVGQLVGESIRAYARRFLAAALVIGAPVALLDVLVPQFERPWSLVAAVGGGALLVPISYVGACALALEVDAGPRRLATAYALAFALFLPFPFLASVFVLPGLVWFAFLGLSVPALLVEGLDVRRALRRGLQLSRADFMHALGGLATLTIVYFVSRFGLAVLLRDQGDQTVPLAAFLSDMVVAPVLFLGSALLYVDQAARVVDSRSSTTQRVRRRKSGADLHPADDAHGTGRADAQVEP